MHIIMRGWSMKELERVRFENSRSLVNKLLVLGRSPNSIAAAAGVSVQHIYGVLNGKSSFGFKVLERVRKYYESELRHAAEIHHIEERLGDRQ
nr:MAG TPA: Regulatory protein-modification, helix-turn-helix, transcriptional regulator, DNA [Caudoviricetes sp.]